MKIAINKDLVWEELYDFLAYLNHPAFKGKKFYKATDEHRNRILLYPPTKTCEYYTIIIPIVHKDKDTVIYLSEKRWWEFWK